MSLPDQPLPGARPSSDAGDLPWHWRLEDTAGTEVVLDAATHPGLAGQHFASQSDAESWVGELFGDLVDAGVDQVVLFEVDRRVYGPMSLHP